jgi:hypothetical protein
MALSPSPLPGLGGNIPVDLEAAVITMVIGLFIAGGAGVAIYYLLEGRPKKKRK